MTFMWYISFVSYVTFSFSRIFIHLNVYLAKVLVISMYFCDNKKLCQTTNGFKVWCHLKYFLLYSSFIVKFGEDSKEVDFILQHPAFCTQYLMCS